MTIATETAAAGTATALPAAGGHEVWIEPMYPEKFTVYVQRPAGVDDEESDEWFEARLSLAVGVTEIFDQLERCGYPRRLIDTVALDVAKGMFDYLLDDDEEPDEAQSPDDSDQTTRQLTLVDVAGSPDPEEA